MDNIDDTILYLWTLCFLQIVILIYQVKLQKHNTEAHGMKYRSGLHCTARILKTEGVCYLYFL